MNVKWKIGIVEYDFNEIMDNLLNETSREEAKLIIASAISLSEVGSPEIKCHFFKRLAELVIYIEKDMANIVCLHLEAMKKDIKNKANIKIKGNSF
jgi:hypothetical protein